MLLNGRFADWVTVRFLGSLLMFDVAFVVPLLSLLPGMETLYKVLLIVSGNWIQLFALFVLQRSQLQIQENQDAKADADHQNISHMMTVEDTVAKIEDEQIEILRRLDTFAAKAWPGTDGVGH